MKFFWKISLNSKVDMTKIERNVLEYSTTFILLRTGIPNFGLFWEFAVFQIILVGLSGFFCFQV